MNRQNSEGRTMARLVLGQVGLTVRRDPDTGEVVIVDSADSGTPVEMGRGPTLLDAVEDAMAEDDEGERMEDYGLPLHLAAALAEDGAVVAQLLIGAAAANDYDIEDFEDDDDDDDDDGGEVVPEERRSVIELHPKRSAG